MLVRKTELIVYDFDGVMTDNKVIFMEDGSEGVAVNRSDGLAVDIFKKRGISQVILSTEKNKVVTARARKLGIPALQGISDKSSSLKKYCRQNKINVKNVVYVGNDLNDLEVMKIAGCPVCPSDACRQVKAVARIILDTAGGDGVVRELLEHIK